MCNKLRKSERASLASEVLEDMVLACKTDKACKDYTVMWHLDSGCSNHMTGRKELFSCLDESTRGKVSFENKLHIQVMGKGEIQHDDGTFVIIANVYYVPELCWNLLSIGQLSERGQSIYFQNGDCTI